LRRPAETLAAWPSVPLLEIVPPAHGIAFSTDTLAYLCLVADVILCAFVYALIERGKWLHNHGIAAMSVHKGGTAGFAELHGSVALSDSIECTVGRGTVAPDS
jgi:hypothetical protein